MRLKLLLGFGVALMAAGGLLTYWALSQENPPDTVAFIGGGGDGDKDAVAVTFADTRIQAFGTFYRSNAQGLDPLSVADAKRHCPDKLTGEQFLPHNLLELHINGNGHSAVECVYEHDSLTVGNVRVVVEQVGAANATKPDGHPLALSSVDLSFSENRWDRAKPVIGGLMVGLGTALLGGAIERMFAGLADETGQRFR